MFAKGFTCETDEAEDTQLLKAKASKFCGAEDLAGALITKRLHGSAAWQALPFWSRKG